MTKYDPALVRALNDALRVRHTGGQIVATRQIHDKGALFLAAAMETIAGPLRFTPDNDPYGEHDFGVVTVFGERLFWKIDYYDQTLTSAAANPADASSCRRILTVVLAEEY